MTNVSRHAYFAGMALQSLVAFFGPGADKGKVAAIAYEYADEMEKIAAARDAECGREVPEGSKDPV